VELITAERLKETIRSEVPDVPYFPAEGRAKRTNDRWLLSCGPYILRSARVNEPRYFKTLDALWNAAEECGLHSLMIDVSKRAG
jgi:hypothetical protein